jgi:hypothetical protein
MVLPDRIEFLWQQRRILNNQAVSQFAELLTGRSISCRSVIQGNALR